MSERITETVCIVCRETAELDANGLFIDLIYGEFTCNPIQQNNEYTHICQSLVSWFATSLSGSFFTSAGLPSCPCHDLWRFGDPGLGQEAG